MNLIRMHFTDPVAWLFMPQLLEKARNFSIKYDLDLTPDLIEEAIRIHFVAKNPVIMSWVAVEGSEVKGHVVTSIDTLSNYEGVVIKKYLTILQAESVVFGELKDVVMEALKDWARENHCDDIQLLAEGKARVRLFENSYGFQVSKTVMTLGGL